MRVCVCVSRRPCLSRLRGRRVLSRFSHRISLEVHSPSPALLKRDAFKDHQSCVCPPLQLKGLSRVHNATARIQTVARKFQRTSLFVQQCFRGSQFITDIHYSEVLIFKILQGASVLGPAGWTITGKGRRSLKAEIL